MKKFDIPELHRIFVFDSGKTITLFNSISDSPWRADINDNSGTVYTGWGDTKVKAIRHLRVVYRKATDPKFKAVMDRLDPPKDDIITLMKKSMHKMTNSQRRIATTYITQATFDQITKMGMHGLGGTFMGQKVKVIHDEFSEISIQEDIEMGAYRVSVKNKVHRTSNTKIHSGVREQIRDGVVPGQKPKRKRWDR